jgi:hypothetical protein
MKRTSLALSVLTAQFLLLPRFALAQDLKSTVPESPVYPTAVGTVWKYRMNYGGQETTVLSTIIRHEELAGLKCAVIDTTTDGSPTSIEYIRPEKDGVRRIGTNGVEMKPHEQILKIPSIKGTTWNGKMDVSGQAITYTSEIIATDESVTVPAGTYQTFVVKTTSSLPGQKDPSVVSIYYAPGVGPVKRYASQGNVSVVLELAEFRAPGAAK